VTPAPEVRHRDRRVRHVLAIVIFVLASVAVFALLMAAMDTR
jgi:hypothetical protein